MNPTEAAADMPMSFFSGGKWVNDELSITIRYFVLQGGGKGTDIINPSDDSENIESLGSLTYPSGDILARPEDRGEASFPEMSSFSCPINAQKMTGLLHIMP